MAFIVEDGTGVEGANSYASVEYADSYFADRGVIAWEGTEAEKQQALVRATDYIELLYSDRWLGVITAAVSGLSWPRAYVMDIRRRYLVNEVPEEVKKATAEYALRALGASLMPDPDSNRQVKRVFEKVGPLETETEYTDTFNEIVRHYPIPDKLLAPYLVQGGGVYR